MRSPWPAREPLGRDFALYLTGQTLSSLGSRVSSIAFPLLTLHITGSPARAGIVGFASTVPFLVFQLPLAAAADRGDRRHVMMIADILRGGTILSVGIAAAVGELTYLHLVLAAFLQGALFALFSAAEAASLPRLVSDDALPRAYSLSEARTRISYIVGQPVGGFLYGVAHAVPFFADASSYLISLGSIFGLKTNLRADRKKQRLTWSELTAGLRFIWRDRFLRSSELIVAGSNFVLQAMTLTLIVYARQAGLGPGTIGLILGASGAGGVLGAMLASRVIAYLHDRRVILACNWLIAVCMPLFALSTSPVLLGVLWGACFFLSPIWNVVISTRQARTAPNELMGRIRGATFLIAWGVIPLGSLASGFLLSRFGARITIDAFAVTMFGVAGFATLSPGLRVTQPPGEPAETAI